MTVAPSGALEQVLERLDHVKRNGSGWIARCPAHEDRKPSLAIAAGDDGRVLLTCHAGCDVELILAALGLEKRDLFQPNGNGARPEIVTTYDYTDAAGELLFQVVRFNPKDFRQRRPDGRGDWTWNLAGVERVLYQLPRVIGAVAHGVPVWVAEGEKDALALEAAGAEVATCNPGGAGKWRSAYAETLRGADVTVVQDRDEPGRKHAAAVYASLHGVAASVRLVEPAEGKDAADHLAADYGLDEFVKADFLGTESNELAELDSKPFDPLDLDLFLAKPPPEPAWDWHGYYAHGDVVIEVGDPGVGKSLNALTRAVLAGTGGGEHLAEQVAGRRVLFIDLESPEDVAYSRLYAFGLRGRVDALEYLWRPPGFNLLDSESLARLRVTIIRHRAEQVWIDSLRRAAPGLDENDSQQVSIVFSALRQIAAELKVTILVIHHPRKPVGDAKVEALYAARGSGDLIGSVDSYLFYRRLRDGLVRIEHGKARRGREHEHVHYRIVEGEAGEPIIDLVDITSVRTAKEADPERLERVFAAVLKLAPASNARVEREVGGNAADVRACLKNLADAGRIRDEVQTSSESQPDEAGRRGRPHRWIPLNDAGSTSSLSLLDELGRTSSPRSDEATSSTSSAPRRGGEDEDEVSRDPAQDEIERLAALGHEVLP
jgi:hypothetical protein